jgi:hypothetical protein
LTTPADPASWHRLLLLLSGRIPDGLLVQARELLAHEQHDELARQVGTWVSAMELALPADAAALLGTTAADPVPDDVPPPYGLAPVSPKLLTAHGDQVPQTLDLTVPGDPHDEIRVLDTLDLTASATAASLPRTAGLWRVWRYPTAATPWAGPKRMYVVEVSAGPPTALPQVTLAMQQALAAAGEPDPLVESYTDGMALPPFQRHARAYGALLWAASPAEPITLARVYDGAGPATGPYFDPAHPLVPDDAERARLLAYLTGGVPLLATGALMADAFDPRHGDVVPMTFRTDGRWIWTEATAYYLDRHRLAPDPELTAWIRANRFRHPHVDGAALHRATAALLSS